VGEATAIMATGRVFVPIRRNADGSPHAVRVPDHVDILAEMACGAQAVTRFSSVMGHAGPPTVTLYGSDGTPKGIRGRRPGGRRGGADARGMRMPAEERSGCHVKADFIGSIRNGTRVRRTGFATGLKYMEFAPAVAESRANGIRVSLT